MSILPVFLLVGVSSARSVGSYDNGAVAEPIETRRICAELCSLGVGGELCGESCIHFLPGAFPLQSINISQKSDTVRRNDACPTLLCANHLDFPLCGCEKYSQTNTTFKVDYEQICSFFCLKYNHSIFGCEPCEQYKQEDIQHGGREGGLFGNERMAQEGDNPVDWEKWCKEQCKIGNGGVACNCDILPVKHTSSLR